MISQPLALTLVVVAITALAFWLERAFAWARQVGASLLVIALGAALSNAGAVPLTSAVYDAITGPITSLAIVWLLLGVDLAGLKAAGPRMLLAFGLAVAATCAGALTAAALFGGAFPEDTWRLAGVMTGTYSGGSVNFAAVGREVGLSGSLLTASVAADNVLTALWMGATLILPLGLRRFYPARRKAVEKEPEEGEAAEAPNPFLAEVPLKPADLLSLGAVGLAVLVAAEAVAARVPGVPAVVWLTTFALAVGAVPAVKALAGSLQIGLLALNLFFAVIGISSRVAEIARVGPEVFYFTAVVVAVHGLLVYGGARLLRLDVETASAASQAAVGGPSSALALTAARGWKDLALPAAVVGLLGYAVGNYAGLAMAWLVRSWGG